MAVNERGVLVGSFYVKPNYPDRCGHICNGGFLVNKEYRGQGIGKFLGGGVAFLHTNIILCAFFTVFEKNWRDQRALLIKTIGSRETMS